MGDLLHPDVLRHTAGARREGLLGFGILGTYGEWLDSAYDAYFDWEEVDNVGNWHRAVRAKLRQNHAMIKEGVKEDYFQAILDSLNQDKREDHTSGKHFLLRHHPTMCGVDTQHYARDFQQYSLEGAEAQGVITNAAHLYNAARQTGLLPLSIEWLGMNYIIKEQRSDWIFVGAPPTEGLDFYTHFHLTFYGGIHKFAKDYNPERARIDSKRSWKKLGTNRKLRHQARQVEVLFERRPLDGQPMCLTRASKFERREVKYGRNRCKSLERAITQTLREQSQLCSSS